MLEVREALPRWEKHALIAFSDNDPVFSPTRRLARSSSLLDLDSRSTRFIGASLLDAIATSGGVERTTGGLHLTA